LEWYGSVFISQFIFSSIDSAQPLDAGVYKCLIANKGGEIEGVSKVEIVPKES